jgi:hypothetical protein
MSYMMIATRSSLALVLTLAFAAPAHAQSAEAETLFREGKRLLKKGEIAEACDKFEASDRLEPTVGTELNLADCRERNGQLATAWAMFVKAAAAAKRADGDGKRAAEARRRAVALEPRLVYLTIVVREAARLDGLVIKRNATPIDAALWDQRVPVDPDEYEISGEAPGHVPWRTRVTVKAKSQKVEVPMLDPRPESAPVAAARGEASGRGAGADAGPIEVGAKAPGPSRFTGRRKLAVGFAAAGAVAAGVGIGFGVHARSLEDQADAICPDVACTDAGAVEINRTARRNALYANLGFAAGGALIAAATVLWLTGAPRARATMVVIPSLDADRAGVSVAGAF